MYFILTIFIRITAQQTIDEKKDKFATYIEKNPSNKTNMRPKKTICWYWIFSRVACRKHEKNMTENSSSAVT